MQDLKPLGEFDKCNIQKGFYKFKKFNVGAFCEFWKMWCEEWEFAYHDSRVPQCNTPREKNIKS